MTAKVSVEDYPDYVKKRMRHYVTAQQRGRSANLQEREGPAMAPHTSTPTAYGSPLGFPYENTTPRVTAWQAADRLAAAMLGDCVEALESKPHAPHVS
jgi:hypothetical protein